MMNLYFSWILFFILLPWEPSCVAGSSVWSEEPSNVIHLDEDNFQSTLKKRKHALVMFYAPWCGHCKSAKPHLVAAAATLAKTKGNEATLAAVDCTKNDALCDKFEVEGYPTFKYLSYGKNPKDYKYGREEDDFVAFMEDPSNPNPPRKKKKADVLREEESRDFWKGFKGAEKVNLILEEEKFDEFIKKHDSVLVMFYAPRCDDCKNLRPTFGEAAHLMKLVGIKGQLAAVDATLMPNVSAKLEVKEYPTLKHFLNGKLAKKQYPAAGERKVPDIVNFMSKHEPEEWEVEKGGGGGAGEASPAPKEDEDGWTAQPDVVTVLNTRNLEDFISSNELAFVLFYAPWCGYCKKLKPAFFEAASTLKSVRPEMKIGAIDASGNRKLLKEFNFKGYPTMILFINGGNGGGGEGESHGEIAEGGGEEDQGRGILYHGDRSADKIIAYLKSVHLSENQGDPESELKEKLLEEGERVKKEEL